MPLNSTVLFGMPQTEIGSLINQKLRACNKVSIVTGFATVEGVKLLEDALLENPHLLDKLIIGAATYQSFEAFDRLIARGILRSSLFVHLGHTRKTKQGARHGFYRYHPMLHSKIYYFEFDDNTASAFVGSHNITGFALGGLNGEASILLEGDVNDPEFHKIRTHISHAEAESVPYDPNMKAAYAWWTQQYMEGVAQKTKDIPTDLDKKRTILLFTQYSDGYPRRNQVLYFELPGAIGTITSLRAEVHLFIFDSLPSTPSECLQQISRAAHCYSGKVEGVENNKGGRELTTDWYIDSDQGALLRRAPDPFRPSPRPEMQQIRVRVEQGGIEIYEYLFGPQADKWVPVLKEQARLSYDDKISAQLQVIKFVQPENVDWFLVEGLSAKDKEYDDDTPYYRALKSLEPEAGGFILVSTARRKHAAVSGKTLFDVVEN